MRLSFIIFTLLLSPLALAATTTASPQCTSLTSLIPQEDINRFESIEKKVRNSPLGSDPIISEFNTTLKWMVQELHRRQALESPINRPLFRALRVFRHELIQSAQEYLVSGRVPYKWFIAFSLRFSYAMDDPIKIESSKAIAFYMDLYQNKNTSFDAHIQSLLDLAPYVVFIITETPLNVFHLNPFTDRPSFLVNVSSFSANSGDNLIRTSSGHTNHDVGHGLFTLMPKHESKLYGKLFFRQTSRSYSGSRETVTLSDDFSPEKLEEIIRYQKEIRKSFVNALSAYSLQQESPDLVYALGEAVWFYAYRDAAGTKMELPSLRKFSNRKMFPGSFSIIAKDLLNHIGYPVSLEEARDYMPLAQAIISAITSKDF